MEFDVAATFGDDYLYFYEESIDDGHSDDDASEILGRLDLEPGARLLDAPCGHGRIARRLAAAGLDVTGVDLSEPFIARARAAPSSPEGQLHYEVGDLRRLPVAGPFDAVVCWYTSFGYYDDVDCRAVLAEFHRVLRPGGAVLIETMHHDGAVRHFTADPDATVVQRGDDAQVDVSRFDPLSGRMVTQRTVYRAGAVRHSAHFIRLPTPPEWVAWLEGAGFSDVRFSAGGGGPLELDSWVMVVQATA
ncbi:MAG TPA: methyltransferase domain-containing protein [Acidimicrobiales bacterium]|nr:methyltransferase domain-containing protein [Acidimicrobiales bacterium]